jgi:mRNA interferase YafQ
MRMIENTGQFKRDYKRKAKGNHRKTLASDLEAVLKLLIADEKLPLKYFDHPLVGDWKDHRDFHIKSVLVLIYRIPDANTYN